MNIKRIAQLAIVAAVYAVGALLQGVTAFGGIQFRLSEILVLLVLFRKDYAWSIIVGCLVANFWSPFFVYDMIFGTAHSVISVLLIIGVSRLNITPNAKLWLASLMVLPACILIGYALNQAIGLPIIATTLTVMLGEFVVVTLLGVPIFNLLTKNGAFMAKV